MGTQVEGLYGPIYWVGRFTARWEVKLEDRPKRRDDRIFAPEFVADLDGLRIEDLRARRDECEEFEAELSYARRLLQGKADIVQHALKRRSAGGQTGLESLIHKLPNILADEGDNPGLKRHTRVMVPRNAENQRREIELLASGLSRVDELSLEELSDLVEVLAEAEARTSASRRQAQGVLDTLNAEMVRRYKEGTEDISALLTS